MKLPQRSSIKLLCTVHELLPIELPCRRGVEEVVGLVDVVSGRGGLRPLLAASQDRGGRQSRPLLRSRPTSLGDGGRRGEKPRRGICSMRTAVTGSTNIREDLVRETKLKARRRVHSARKGLGTGQNQGLASDTRWPKLASEKTGFACNLF